MEFTGLSDSPKAARKAAERTRQRKKGAFAPRPKQVQLQSLQAKLDELLEQYKAAEAENKRLKERLTLIEVVLPTREHQAKIAAAAGSRGSSGALPRPLQATPAPAGTDGGPGASPGLSPRYPLSPSPSPATGPDAASSVSASTPSGSGQAANNRAGEEAACAQSRSPQPLPGPQLGPPASGGAGLQNLQHPRALASEPPTVLPGQTPPQPQPLSLSLQHAGHAASAAVAVAAKRRPGRRPEAAAPPPQPPPPGDDDGLSAAWRALWMAWVRDAALLIVAHDARPGGGYWLQRLDEACTRLKTQVVQLGLKHPELIADDMPQLNLGEVWGLCGAGAEPGAQGPGRAW
ncbi:hypothetical protein HYH02_000326 [Chlamydomonas schloesseri]|uniref:Uncharacterized protein n=1 Tax=Chlamydomonas schloesseri TaxID=2026947 RepID=A0A835WP71_9CHLO|nr:hypothetical protein HYH02_000326 [Chlamydomonas schloesseri]|eukprot:KAG2450225.1 hypothetical protein HYH02_000326 [Chlamydomonas schloesseri]